MEGNEFGFGIESDFDVTNEWKPTPLIPNGTYKGAITEVTTDQEQMCIAFSFTLNENGGYMSDGETPIDGAVLTSRVYIPKPGDENELTSSGKMTKRQAKINMMKDFQERMKININSPSAILSGIANGEWLGLAVLVTVNAREWEGRVFNDVKKVVAA